MIKKMLTVFAIGFLLLMVIFAADNHPMDYQKDVVKSIIACSGGGRFHGPICSVIGESGRKGMIRGRFFSHQIIGIVNPQRAERNTEFSVVFLCLFLTSVGLSLFLKKINFNIRINLKKRTLEM